VSLGAVIVTYNSAGYIDRCLRALQPWMGRVVAEVVVVDNNSRDDTREQAAAHANVRLIANPCNTGFAAAANQGVRAIAPDLILLLNPDAEIVDRLNAITEAFKDPRVGAAGGRLLDGRGEAQRGFQVRRFPTPVALALEVLGINRLWPSNRVNVRYRCLDLDPLHHADVEQPAGAFLAFRRSAWEQAGGLDERFKPLWFEDVDFCLMLRRKGWRILYVPEATACHAGGHSISSISRMESKLYWYGSLLRYTGKHFGVGGRLLVASAVGVAAGIWSIAGIIGYRSITPVIMFGKVVRSAAACLLGVPVGSLEEGRTSGGLV